MVLLRVVSTVLPTSVPAVRSNTMAGRLAQQLFQVSHNCQSRIELFD